MPICLDKTPRYQVPTLPLHSDTRRVRCPHLHGITGPAAPVDWRDRSLPVEAILAPVRERLDVQSYHLAILVLLNNALANLGDPTLPITHAAHERGNWVLDNYLTVTEWGAMRTICRRAADDLHATPAVVWIG